MTFTKLSFVIFTADEAATVRVTNLSEDTIESDLQELFRPFGQISRIYLAKDKITNQSKVIFFDHSDYHLIMFIAFVMFIIHQDES